MISVADGIGNPLSEALAGENFAITYIGVLHILPAKQKGAEAAADTRKMMP